VAIGGYRLERCQGTGCTDFAPIASVTTTTYSDLDLTAATSYTYRILARDLVGNVSGYSATASTTTLASGGTYDTSPPSMPTQLTVTAITSGEVDLGWAASTDDVGVTAYLVESCRAANCTNFIQIGAPLNISFAASGLVPSTTYTFRVRAMDAAGNLGNTRSRSAR
jgi:predicted phage tail protein